MRSRTVAVEVLVAELQSLGSEKVLTPLGDSVIDFPNLPAENVLDVGSTVAVEGFTRSKLRSLFTR